MPRPNAIDSLSSISLAELVKVIVHTVGITDAVDLEIIEAVIKSYLRDNGATSAICQDLLRIILRSDSLEASIRFACLKMLLNDAITALVTEIFPFSYYEKILKVIASQGTSLRVLNLKGVWVKDEHMCYMYKIVQRLTHLTNLSIPHIANDELLEEIGKYCRYLRWLDVAGETDITEIGIYGIANGLCRDSLTYVDIGMLREETICHEDIALLIESMPNLRKIDTYSFVGRSVRFIHKKDPRFRCKLTYLHDTDTSSIALASIVECCPELREIYLGTPSPGILHQLSRLDKLEKIKLYKFECEELDELLPLIGSKIRHLTVIKGRGLFDLTLLATMCPHMVELDCYLMEMLVYNGDRKFGELEAIEILNSTINLGFLKNFIVTHASVLRRLAVDAINFTDEDVILLFEANVAFPRLEDVWFTSAPNLSIKAVESLMKLPMLSSLGQLSGWNLDPDDIQLIRGVIRSKNSSLSLSLYH